jgi:hypothetical protein
MRKAAVRRTPAAEGATVGDTVVLGARSAQPLLRRYGPGQDLLGGLHVRDLIHRMIGLAARPREAPRPRAQSLLDLDPRDETSPGTSAPRSPVPAAPAQVSELLLRGRRHHRSGDQVSALMCYQELVALDPDNEDYRLLLSKAYQAMLSGGIDV